MSMIVDSSVKMHAHTDAHTVLSMVTVMGHIMPPAKDIHNLTLTCDYMTFMA